MKGFIQNVFRTLNTKRYISNQAESQLDIAQHYITALHRVNLTKSSVVPIINCIVSLTSYGTRIASLHITLLSLLNQSVRPQKIIVWLAHDEALTEDLNNLKKWIEFRFCDDIKSYKKLIPTLRLNLGLPIMTFDDDVIYPYNHVERLYKEHKKSPKDVVCHRAHAILVHNNSVKPYQQWSFDVSRLDAGSLIFPVGIGGILYPDGCFNDVVCNESLFMALCPTADDIWFKFMALKNGYKAKVVNQPLPYEQYLQVGGSQKVSLWQKNKTQNDKQLNALLTHDSSLFELLQ